LFWNLVKISSKLLLLNFIKISSDLFLFFNQYFVWPVHCALSSYGADFIQSLVMV
jgi:hypothetical protein